MKKSKSIRRLWFDARCIWSFEAGAPIYFADFCRLARWSTKKRKRALAQGLKVERRGKRLYVNQAELDQFQTQALSKLV